DALPTHTLFHQLQPRDPQQRVEKPFACLRPQPEPWPLFARLHARHHLEAAASVEYQIFCFRVNCKTHKIRHTVFTTSLGTGLALVGGPVVPAPPLSHHECGCACPSSHSFSCFPNGTPSSASSPPCRRSGLSNTAGPPGTSRTTCGGVVSTVSPSGISSHLALLSGFSMSTLPSACSTIFTPLSRCNRMASSPCSPGSLPSPRCMSPGMAMASSSACRRRRRGSCGSPSVMM